MSDPGPSVRRDFTREVRQADERVDLARAALLVAREQYPGLSVEGHLGRLDQMAEEVKDRIGGEPAELVAVQELLGDLFARKTLPREPGGILRSSQLLPE